MYITRQRTGYIL